MLKLLFLRYYTGIVHVNNKKTLQIAILLILQHWLLQEKRINNGSRSLDARRVF